MEKVNGVLTNVNYDDIEMLKTNPTEFWKGVTKIGNGAFIGRTNLERINIPKGVTEIEDSAFSSCINLTKICRNYVVRALILWYNLLCMN